MRREIVYDLKLNEFKHYLVVPNLNTKTRKSIQLRRASCQEKGLFLLIGEVAVTVLV